MGELLLCSETIIVYGGHKLLELKGLGISKKQLISYNQVESKVPTRSLRSELPGPLLLAGACPIFLLIFFNL